MDNIEMIEEIEDKIEKLFANDSVPKEQTREDLEIIISVIQQYLNAIGEN